MDGVPLAPMEVWLGAEAGGAGGGTDVPAFPRALPRRGTRRSVPVGVTDDLIFAVRGMPDQYRFVTARILSDRGCVSAAVVALMEAHTTSVLPEAVLLALPSEDCRFLLCESGRTLVVWLPEDAHADTQVCVCCSLLYVFRGRNQKK